MFDYLKDDRTFLFLETISCQMYGAARKVDLVFMLVLL